MTHIESNATTQHFPDVQVVESVLGMPLFPEGFDIAEALRRQTDARCDVRIKTYELALSAITDLVDRHPSAALPEKERQRVAATDDILFLQGLLAVANNIYLSEGGGSPARPPEGADNPATPRALVQARLTQRMFEHIQTVPRSLTYQRDTPLREQCNDNMVVVAPTGSGKSVLEATLMREAGIGKEINPANGQLLKGILATSGVRLVEQFAGLRGDDTFRRFTGAIGVTRYYSNAKSTDGPIVVTTGHSLSKLNPREYALAVIDEGHLALGPQALEFIGKIGIRCFLFTATPAYNMRNDLRRYFRHIEEGSLRSFVEQGVLNPVRLLTFQYDDNPEFMAASLAHHYVQKNRKVVIYCPNGAQNEPAAPAKRVVQLTNAMGGGNIAQYVGVHNKNSDRDVTRFEEGELQVLATTRMLREGWNADVDVVICIGPHYSLVDLRQKIGRALRPGRYTSELIELVPKTTAFNRVMVSLWQEFGLDCIISGTIIGPLAQIESPLTPADKGEVNDDGAGQEAQALQEEIDLSLLSPDLRSALVINKPLRVIVMGENSAPPEGYVPFTDLAEKHDISLRVLRRMFDAQGFSFYGVWTPGDNGKDYDRWYEPAVLDYLEKNPIPKKAQGMELSSAEAGEICDISERSFKFMAKTLGIVPHERRNKNNNRMESYDFTQIALVLSTLEAIPVADEDDIVVNDLVKEMGSSMALRAAGVFKRRHPAHGYKGWCKHVTAEEAARLREEFYAVPVADEAQHMHIRKVAGTIGTEPQHLLRNMTPEETAAICFLRSRPKARAAQYLPIAEAAAIIERLKPDKLPGHLIPIDAIAQRLPIQKIAVAKWLHNHGYEPVFLRLGAVPIRCYSWTALQSIEAAYGRLPTVPPITYTKVVQSESDPNPERWQYTQAIQKQYRDASILAPAPTSNKEMRAAEKPATPKLPATPEEDTAPLDEARRRELIAASRPSAVEKQQRERRSLDTKSTPVVKPRPVTSKQSRTPVPARQADKTPIPAESPPTPAVKPASIPRNYINLVAYLSELDISCEPSVLTLLLRRHKLTRIRDDADITWAPEETALTLEEVIKDFPLAAEGTASPKQLAQPFAGKGILDKHIVHLTSQLTSSLEGRFKICRTQQADGNPGELNIHYDPELAQRIQSNLAMIVKDPSLLRILLRWGNLPRKFFT